MKKVSLVQKAFLFTLFLLLVSILPLPASNYFSNVVVAQASEEANEDPTSVKLNVKNVTLVTDNSYTLKIRNTTDSQRVYFKSSNSDIASVEQDKKKSAVITGTGVGTTTITVIVKNGFKTSTSLSCDIVVGPPALSVKFLKSKLNLQIDKRTTLITILKPNNTTETANFTSSDPSIASVNPTSGKVTAHSLGKVEITAKIANGKFDTCDVTVVKGGSKGQEETD